MGPKVIDVHYEGYYDWINNNIYWFGFINELVLSFKDFIYGDQKYQ